MALQKQAVNLNFSQGLNRKGDPYQIPLGQFLALNNMTFNTPDRMTKRDGYAALSATPSNSAITLTTFDDNLIALGSSLSSYDTTSAAWYSKGTYQPLDISTVGAIRNASNQVFCDAASSGALTCITYVNKQNNPIFGTSPGFFSIVDSTTGQSLYNAPLVAVTNSVQTMRVFYLSPYFIIVFQNTGGQLQYISINATTLAVGGIQTISTDALASIGKSFDAVVLGTKLYIAWTNTATNKVLINSLSNALVLGTAQDGDASRGGASIGMCADSGANLLWVVYSVYGTETSVRAFSFNTSLVVQTSSLVVITTTATKNVTGYATGSVLYALAEDGTSKDYDTTIENSRIISNTVTAGVAGTQAVLNYQLGLASKAFFIGTRPCVWAAWQSTNQNSYYLLYLTTSTATAVGKLAYGNGGGYLDYGLPSVTTASSNYYFPYLYRYLLEPVNKGTNNNSTSTNPISPGGIYAQYGVNLATFTVPDYATNIDSGASLVIGGGIIYEYAGGAPTYPGGIVEQNFFLWPELMTNITLVDSFNLSGYGGISQSSVSLTPNVTTLNGSPNATLSDYTNVKPGLKIVAVGIPTNTYILYVQASVGIIMSKPATATATVASTITSNVASQTYFYQFIYQWSDNKGNIHNSSPSVPISIEASSANCMVTIKVPALPLTYKSDVKILGFRWADDQQAYFQFTRVDIPVLNDTTATSVTIYDTYSSAQILGNSLLYTTGGVVENISPNASSQVILFDNRVWFIDAEDRNRLWYSKQLIESVPVEFSDLFTYFVAPTQGGQGSTGKCTAIGYLDDKLIIFKGEGNAIYYINGAGPDNTGANNQYSQPIFITSPVGCTNQRSITLTPNGLMFQAANAKGIWLLGRDLGVSYIGSAVESYNAYTVTSAVTVPNTNQVRFTMSDGTTLVYDYYVEQWSTFTGVNAASSCIYDSAHSLLSTGGTAYKQTAGTYVDGATSVTMSFTTGWINLAGLRGYERSYFFFLLGTYLSAHTLTFQIYYDYDDTVVQTSTFTPSDLSANDIEDVRVFLTNQRCKAFKLTVTESVSASGAGLTISGIQAMVGLKKSYATISAAKSVGE